MTVFAILAASADLGMWPAMTVSLNVLADSNACIGVCQRTGLGKICNINVALEKGHPQVYPAPEDQEVSTQHLLMFVRLQDTGAGSRTHMNHQAPTDAQCGQDRGFGTKHRLMPCVARVPRVKHNLPADALRMVVSEASVAGTISFLLASCGSGARDLSTPLAPATVQTSSLSWCSTVVMASLTNLWWE